jgi:hypothetical protein
MAIINCPGCGRRISDQRTICTHCELPLGEVSDEDLRRIQHKRWRKRTWQAKNVTYIGMAVLMAGIFGWWLIEPTGWSLPLPPVPIVLLALGVLIYLCGRGWLFWLRMRRNRPQ